MRIGVLGGSFDPPHLGHLVLADQCAAALDLLPVLLIPAYRPPHKTGREQTPFELRLAMVRAAVSGHPRLAVSEIERERGGLSYTVDTLRALRQAHPGDEIWLLMGEDSLADLFSWREPEALAELARIAVYHRPGSPARTPDFLAGKVRFVAGPAIDISSSELRRRLEAGESVRYLIPEPALEIIRRDRLYLPGDADVQRASGES